MILHKRFQFWGIIWLLVAIIVVAGWLSDIKEVPVIVFVVSPTHTTSPTPTALPLSDPTSTLTQTPKVTTAATRPRTFTITPSPSPHPPTPTVIPTPTPVPLPINGLTLDKFLIMPDAVRQNIQGIFAYGQTLDRDPTHFSKLGDSVVDTGHFLTLFDRGPNNLGDYAYLQSTLDHFAGSFARLGPTARDGLNTWIVFDPMWADKEVCQPGEHMLACELRLHNPCLLLIALGTNDPGYRVFEENLREIVVYTIDNGVVPVLVTKANRIEGDNSYNTSIRSVAVDYQIPVWDFDVVADTLPGRGLDQDQVHLTVFSENDYTLNRAFYSGYGVLNLTGLMVLNAIWQILD